MGNGHSKTGQHVFNADAPVRLSQSVIESLQSSAETDSSRSRDTELKIQARVNSELSRIRDAQAKQLDSLTASLTTDPSKQEDSSQSSRDPNTLAAHLSSPFYHAWGSSTSDSAAASKDSGRSHDSVSKEIQELRAKLDARKQVEKTTPEVDKAKGALLTCLRKNDRRPLDCYQEVEDFKAEVAKLEQAFVRKAAQ